MRVVARAGIGLVALVLAAAASPAYAAEPNPEPQPEAELMPDLSVSLVAGQIEVDGAGVTIGIKAENRGTGPATGVTLSIDTVAVIERVDVSLVEGAGNCTFVGAVVQCEIGDLAAGATEKVFPVRLSSKPRAAGGDAGALTVTIQDATDFEANPADNTGAFPVTVIAAGPDLAAVAEDVGSPARRVGPGDRTPLRASVVNEGDTATAGITVVFQLFAGATFGERYADCVYRDSWPGRHAPGFVYGPDRVTCTGPLVLGPGESVPLVDPLNGRDLFSAVFGRNLAGPLRWAASFHVSIADGARLAQSARRAADRRTFAAKLAALKGQPAQRRMPRAAVPDTLDTSDNVAKFSVYSKRNTLDTAVSVAPVTAGVGDIVTVTAVIANHGPSDGDGPLVAVTAPAGTVLLPARSCVTPGTGGRQRPQSHRLECDFHRAWPAGLAAARTVTLRLRLKVLSAPGTDGVIVAGSARNGSAEANWGNNAARIVVVPPGGSGGGLPVTGARTGPLAGTGVVLVALGFALCALGRRRPRDQRPAATR